MRNASNLLQIQSKPMKKGADGGRGQRLSKHPSLDGNPQTKNILLSRREREVDNSRGRFGSAYNLSDT